MGASTVSAHPCVRGKLAELQREVGRNYDVVMDGRDITTNVLPHTKHKFFVTARPEVRAERRFKELRARGNTTETYEQVLADIKLRDHNDSTRAYMPLRQTEDAVLIDTSDGEQGWTTVGVGTNVIEASWEALSDAYLYGLIKGYCGAAN